MRTVIMMEDPYRGSTERQDIAQRDLDRLTCEDTKDLWRFMHEFRILAINSGKLYFPSTTEKYFSKLSPILSQRVQEAFKRKYPGLIAGVLPAIKFTHTFVSEICKEVALSKELRDLSFCLAVPIPGYYKNNRKRYGIRKARAYKGKPHRSHVKMFKNKYKDDRGKQGKKMSQRRVPTLFSVREGPSTDDLPTQDDQVCNYQWTQRRSFELQQGIRRLRGQRYTNTLESLVNPEQQLAISGRRQ
ncbi:hypothetical protein Tco_0061170 [Tanacetum coccineum]